MAALWRTLPTTAHWAIIGAGILALLVVTLLTQSGGPRSTLPMGSPRRPGWLARRRARQGATHPRDGGCTVGRSAWHRSVALPAGVLRLGGLVFGAPGSGKTFFVRLLVQAAALAGRGCIIIDPKGSPQLRETVADLGGLVFTIGGWLTWNPLEADPVVMAQQLLAAIPEDANAPRVYHDGFRLAVLQLGKAMAQAKEEPDLRRIVHLLRSGAWADYCQEHLGADFVAPAAVEAQGVQTGAAGLATLLLGPAGANLGSGPDCLSLADALDRGQIVLLSLPSARGDMTRQLGLWALLGLQAQLSKRIGERHTPALVILDEAYRLGKRAAQLAVDLMGEGREAGVAVVQVTQGPSDMEEHGRHVLARAAQDAAWTMLFRQGTLDADRASRLLGTHLVEERTWSDGAGGRRTNSKHVSAPWAAPYELEALGRHTGEAWLRIPAGQGEDVRVEHLHVASPRPNVRALPRVVPSVILEPVPDPALPTGAPPLKWLPRIVPALPSPPEEGTSSEGTGRGTKGITPIRDEGTLSAPECGIVNPLRSRVIGDSDPDHARFWSRVVLDAVTGCWESTYSTNGKAGRPKARINNVQKLAYQWTWLWFRGPIPKGKEIDHLCQNNVCVNPDHLQLVAKRPKVNMHLRWDRPKRKAA